MLDKTPDRADRADFGAPRTGSGFGRLLVLVYGTLAVAATARATYQLASHGGDAPLAYGLSLAAGVVYVVATLALARGTARWRQVAWAACSIELVGVLSVGVATLVDDAAFPDATVWSSFGSGYGYVPLVLPVIGLVWLWRTREPSLKPRAEEH
ncbi:hypothetical protein ATL42_0747 [Sanguibacter antarcticus]|uniref:Integral membrane protein n=1 Tax=Sanguibacter antarcticus TaxID=372484 RepID=A0A2A9E3F8_9MICO|nr:hypothetical protein ATL42_0747 [Sanguibacter antarcticus]